VGMRTMAEQIIEELRQMGYSSWDIEGRAYESGAYSDAIELAEKFGGEEIFYSDDYSSLKSFAPTIIFEFKDGSKLQVDYSGVSAGRKITLLGAEVKAEDIQKDPVAYSMFGYLV